MEKTSNEASDTELLRQLGYVRAIDESVSRLTIASLVISSKLSLFSRKVLYSFGLGLEDCNQILTWY
ncbi:MAG: hypothetical protein JWM55_1613 [Acidimicrobiaceae bacterium]|nr:hypothetical protein [Acidimicrobiaceae bacterium]